MSQECRTGLADLGRQSAIHSGWARRGTRADAEKRSFRMAGCPRAPGAGDRSLPGDQAAVPPQPGSRRDQPVRPQPAGQEPDNRRGPRSARSSRGRGVARRSTATRAAAPAVPRFDPDERLSRSSHPRWTTFGRRGWLLAGPGPHRPLPPPASSRAHLSRDDGGQSMPERLMPAVAAPVARPRAARSYPSVLPQEPKKDVDRLSDVVELP
jgi:hypothetical protein